MKAHQLGRSLKRQKVSMSYSLPLKALHTTRAGAVQHNLGPKAKNLCEAFNM